MQDKGDEALNLLISWSQLRLIKTEMANICESLAVKVEAVIKD